MKNLVMFLAAVSIVGCGHPDATISPNEVTVIPIISPINSPFQPECIPFIRKHGHRQCYLCVINNEQIKLCEVRHESK